MCEIKTKHLLGSKYSINLWDLGDLTGQLQNKYNKTNKLIQNFVNELVG